MSGRGLRGGVGGVWEGCWRGVSREYEGIEKGRKEEVGGEWE